MKRFFTILITFFILTLFVQNSYASYKLGKEAFDKKRYKQAMEYFMVSSDDVDSIYHIGLMHQSGLVVKKNYSEAFDWYEKGVELGGENSRIALARLYATGLGVPLDTDYALKLLNEGNRDDMQNKIATIALLRLGYGPDNSKELADSIISATTTNKREIDALNRQVNQYMQLL
ncbi:MAG: sel1 repeat family protein, partial [Synergistaceae bacterium]|nr:sel1 repeat family protein [Synergistaceae bacterium]